jgi:hypothetical protein
MRRKSDMWQSAGDVAFLPGESEQAAQAALIDAHDRIKRLEEQLNSQFTSMAAYAQIAQQSIDVARAESRADLEREKAMLVSLVERVRDECRAPSAAASPSALAPPAGPAATTPASHTPRPDDVALGERLDRLETRFDMMSQQFGQCLRSQEDLANSIAFMFEHQMRNAGWLANCDEAAANESAGPPPQQVGADPTAEDGEAPPFAGTPLPR